MTSADDLLLSAVELQHQRRFGELSMIAMASDDRETQVGCLIAGRLGGQIAASNRIPDGLETTQERVTRPEKYKHIQHAEIRAIAGAARHGLGTGGSTMYLNWFPCNQCAMAIVQAGIKEIHVNRKAYEARAEDPRYEFAESLAKLEEARVRIVWR